jgi:hypothetical protein
MFMSSLSSSVRNSLKSPPPSTPSSATPSSLRNRIRKSARSKEFSFSAQMLQRRPTHADAAILHDHSRPATPFQTADFCIFAMSCPFGRNHPRPRLHLAASDTCPETTPLAMRTAARKEHGSIWPWCTSVMRLRAQVVRG